jgi:DNA polymerase-3 subunit epsilon
VYVELLGGRQRHLSLEPEGGKPAAGAPEADNAASAFTLNGDPSKFDRPHGPSDEELAAHRALLERLEDPVWNR